MDLRGYRDLIRQSRLFDPDWYAMRNDLQHRSEEDVLRHYEEQGGSAGSAPSPLFDPVFYAESAGIAVGDALAHYLTIGFRDLRSPHPLFDVPYYYVQRPDVRAAGYEPVAHYLDWGALEGTKPNPLFDTSWYLGTHPSIRGVVNPLVHYVRDGEALGWRPSARFDPAAYVAENPDVADYASGPLAHYLLHGRREGRKLPSSRVLSAASPAADSRRQRRWPSGKLASISAVIPTYNRADLLDETLRRLHDAVADVDVEFIVINDGSTDRTSDVLQNLARSMPNLVWREIANGGPGRARNLGASLATKDVVLFLGDDIQPLNDEFFRTHARLHASYDGDQFAVLGKCVWPEHADQDVTFVMAHIQGKGGEQFGYSDLTPFSFIDWRFFYTANVSVKRTVVGNWLMEGFKPEFTLAAFEDGELAYRLSQRPQGFVIYYDPTSIGRHIHPYTVDGFISRQLNAGMMAKIFLDMHDNAEQLGVADLKHALDSDVSPLEEASLVSEYMAMIEGVKAWARMLDKRRVLGREHWHNDLLYAVFHLSYQQGFVLAAAIGQANVPAAYAIILKAFLDRIRAIIHHEATPHEFLQRGLGLHAA